MKAQANLLFNMRRNRPEFKQNNRISLRKDETLPKSEIDDDTSIDVTKDKAKIENKAVVK